MLIAYLLSTIYSFYHSFKYSIMSNICSKMQTLLLSLLLLLLLNQKHHLYTRLSVWRLFLDYFHMHEPLPLFFSLSLPREWCSASCLNMICCRTMRDSVLNVAPPATCLLSPVRVDRVSRCVYTTFTSSAPALPPNTH